MYEGLCEMITEKSGMPASWVDVKKGGVTVKGIRVGDGDIVPTIYPQNYGEMEMGKMVDKIISVVKNAMDDMNTKQMKEFADGLMKWDYCKDKLMICVRPKTDFDEQIKREFLDIEQYVRVCLDKEHSVVVTSALCDRWGKTEEDVFSTATTGKHKLENIGKILYEASHGEISANDLREAMSSGMIVITNENKFNGANALCDADFWKRFKDINFEAYVLPSSVHELIVIQKNDEMDLFEIKDMVRVVNDTEVSPEERLSYNVYECVDGEIRIAA